MPKESQNYNSGKCQEKEAYVYMRQYGFVRPDNNQRKIIEEALYKVFGAEIKRSAFDLVPEKILPFCNDGDNLANCIIQSGLGNKSYPELVLYEMKSAGSKRQQKIKQNWKGFGFTITQNEEHNWVELGDDGYKFIFVDLCSTPARYRILNRAEWDNPENCRPYTTRSIWIKSL
jgi:hypothetical protein